jgi:DNA-binding MarR family transcriptional regulator
VTGSELAVKGEKRVLKQLVKTLDQLHSTSGAFKEIEEAAAREAGGQSMARWQVINTASSGEWTVPDIARRLCLTRQSVQRIAHALVEEDLASFATNPDRRNSPYLRLTLLGSQTWASIAHSLEQRLMKSSTGVDRKQLKSARRDLLTLQTAAQNAMAGPQ